MVDSGKADPAGRPSEGGDGEVTGRRRLRLFLFADAVLPFLLADAVLLVAAAVILVTRVYRPPQPRRANSVRKEERRAAPGEPQKAAQSGPSAVKNAVPEGVRRQVLELVKRSPRGKVRFLCLEHAEVWGGLGAATGSANNMLREFHVRTGLPCKDRAERIDTYWLGKLMREHSPPFVYVTGKRQILVDKRDVSILRDYLTKHRGLLFADNGGGYFHHSVTRLVARLFPGQQWVDIPNDDEIYHCYYKLPAGAPPLWHHSGRRALGIKRGGRWVVFYHQGNLNDAWEDGHSGCGPQQYELAYQMGVNVIWYSLTRDIEAP